MVAPPLHQAALLMHQLCSRVLVAVKQWSESSELPDQVAWGSERCFEILYTFHYRSRYMIVRPAPREKCCALPLRNPGISMRMVYMG